ncbi:MAG TPA: hypothetical protein VJT14_07380 [Candidatus Dormibacteraeota bacterium]|nr:hypothetical protein [Candidatus Dormibacteraeota bacterium]
MRRPEDECPYPKPFSESFDDCPAYQARQFIPLDTVYQPLEPVLTCRHLETRSMTQRHRWYGACALGTSDDRSRWTRQVGVARLERIRAVQRELGGAIAPYSTRLWELKGQQLRAIRDGSDAGPATVELRRLAGMMTGELDQFLHKRSAAFAEIDMPIDAALKLIQVAVDRFIDTQHASEISFEVPDHILQRFPESVRIFFRPEVRPPANR